MVPLCRSPATKPDLAMPRSLRQGTEQDRPGTFVGPWPHRRRSSYRYQWRTSTIRAPAARLRACPLRSGRRCSTAQTCSFARSRSACFVFAEPPDRSRWDLEQRPHLHLREAGRRDRPRRGRRWHLAGNCQGRAVKRQSMDVATTDSGLVLGAIRRARGRCLCPPGTTAALSKMPSMTVEERNRVLADHLVIQVRPRPRPCLRDSRPGHFPPRTCSCRTVRRRCRRWRWRRCSPRGHCLRRRC